MAKRKPSTQQEDSEAPARKQHKQQSESLADGVLRGRPWRWQQHGPSGSSCCAPRSERRLCHNGARLARKKGTEAAAAGGTADARERGPYAAVPAVLLGAGGPTVAAKKRTAGARAASEAASRDVLRPAKCRAEAAAVSQD